MIRQSILFLILSSLVAVACWGYQPSEPFKPGKLSPTEQKALREGLTLRFYDKTQKQPIDARRVRLAALHVPEGSAPSPFIASGPFHARLTGYIKIPLKATFSFRLVGTGAIVLTLNDKVILNHPDASKTRDKEAEVELVKNYNRIEIDYVSPPKGDSTVRLYWSGEKFGFEPVPPDVFSSPGDDADLVAKTHLREGRLLYANHHCVACHGLPGNVKKAECKMPEVNHNPPSLDDAGNRFQADWLAAWLMNPRKLRPEATMPVVLQGSDAEKKAVDIAAYLGTVKQEGGLKPLGKASKAADGEAIFKKYGCNTCHRLSEPQEQDEMGRLSLHHVGAKFTANALAHFLKSPHSRYPWTRMPDFKLSDAEAGHLEAYLRDQAKGKLPPQPKGNPDQGRQWFQQVGCVNCHQIHPEKSQPEAAALKITAVSKGCLADKDHGKAPSFDLKESERAALRAFLQTDGSSLTRETPAEFSLRQVHQLQCASCHRRDGAMTHWHQVLEEEGKTPESLPMLTWTGEKLKPAWTQKLLAGESGLRARPWLKARMPAFPARAEMLAVGLSHEHGFGVLEDDRPAPDAKLAEIGKKLLPQAGGFNCINCHGVDKQPALEPFEAPGINLLDAALRLRYEYYRRWMRDPSRVDVAVRMPVFVGEDGKTTQIRDVFDGNAQRQYDAIWHYIQTLPGKAK